MPDVAHNEYCARCHECGDEFQEDTLTKCADCLDLLCVECWNAHRDCDDSTRCEKCGKRRPYDDLWQCDYCGLYTCPGCDHRCPVPPDEHAWDFVA
jgi:hypothetical protein